MHKYSLWPKSIGQKLMALGGALITIPLLDCWYLWLTNIIKEKTAMVVDIFELADAVFPEWGAYKERLTPSEASLQVLLAEDSSFFRSQMKKYLEDYGYKVVAAEDGEQAWEKLLANLATIKAVITDIEMPRLNGLGLARRIRADERTAS